jgi:hypothetical protein
MLVGGIAVSKRATLDAIRRDLDDALNQAREAYVFTPSSFTASSLAAITAARDAFAAYHAVVTENGGRETVSLASPVAAIPAKKTA